MLNVVAWLQRRILFVMNIFSSIVSIVAHFTAGTVLSLSGGWSPPPVQPTTFPSVPSKPTSQRIATTTPPKAKVAATSTKSIKTTPPQAPKKVVAPTPIKQAPIAPTTSEPTPSPVATPAPVITYKMPEEVNFQIRESLVNILCTTRTGGSYQPISGSGIIVSNKGVVLTNAHVAQFFLLQDYNGLNSINCVIRTGSPAAAKYTARLLYLPPAWVQENADQLKLGVAMGTGEDDFAFLLITGRTDGTPLAATFPNALLTIDTPSLGDPIVLASYPAQFLGGTNIQMNLYASSAVSTVEKLYTFAKDTGPVDAVSVGNPIIAQAGSSGGIVARLQDGAIMGLIATATEGQTTSGRELRAVTLTHIDRSLAKYGKGGFIPFIAEGNLTTKADDFTKNVAPGLTQKLIDALRR